ncbi:sodium-coupled monocarboxylate transporter 1-like isoform X3 [Portunus trituberculatus]|uniref:sodium-coupled monocarboxylate transporter 1-like isoform X3 n=1 Tax=Portunus trituberculatus TaxID=210409 RepID=UPI001E1CB913|nr:sodium-coupled monocarboxylate transporter 1-like isoform X3 [Portunus trituberculatus]
MGLGTLDVVMLVLSLLASAAVGVYFSVLGRNSTSVEYLLGGRTMKPLPLALSLMVGTVSAITIMGSAGEMYAYGTQLWLMDLGILLALFIIAKYFIPIMYPLELISLYQYIEKRFKSKWLRQATAVLQLVGGYLFIGFLLFPPSLALQSMMGLSFFVNIIIIGVSCTLYSTFGGVKAVVYADTLQAVVMIVGVLAIVIQGAVNMGGIENVLDIAYHGDRLEFFNMSLNPYQRHSFWLCVIYGFFFTLSNNAVNQSQVQRYFSTGSVRNAQCSVSTQLNSMTALLWEDFLKVLPVFRDWSEIKVGYLQKLIVFLSGVLGIVLGLAVSQFGKSFFTTVLAINGALTGPLIGLFIVALFLPWVPAKGATIGFILAIAFNGVMVIGQQSIPKAPYLPLSKEGCPATSIANVTANVTEIEDVATTIVTTLAPTLAPTLENITTTVTPSPVPSEGIADEWLFGLSYCLNPLWGSMLCILLSLIASAITGYNTPEDVEEKLVDPGMWRIFQRSLKLQIKESFYKTILRRRPRGDHNARDTSDETGTRDPLNNLMDTKDTKDNEIDGNGVV